MCFTCKDTRAKTSCNWDASDTQLSLSSARARLVSSFSFASSAYGKSRIIHREAYMCLQLCIKFLREQLCPYVVIAHLSLTGHNTRVVSKKAGL